MKTINTLLTLMAVAILASCIQPKKKEEVAEVKPPKLVGKEISYASDTLTMKGYIAYDENAEDKRPGILVVHEWWGHNAHARERADMLAEMGYVALAVDMYGDGKQAQHPGEAGAFAGMVTKNIDEGKKRFESALETLKANPKVDGEKIGAIGFCFGGSVVLSMANAGYDLDAVAAFHAGLQLPIMPESGSVKAQILVANGGADPMITEAHVASFKQALDSAGADYKYVSYDGVVHAFTNKEADSIANQFEPLKGALAYDAAADSASWEELKVLFAESF